MVPVILDNKEQIKLYEVKCFSLNNACKLSDWKSESGITKTLQ